MKLGLASITVGFFGTLAEGFKFEIIIILQKDLESTTCGFELATFIVVVIFEVEVLEIRFFDSSIGYLI